jgi:hypothetical protein
MLVVRSSASSSSNLQRGCEKFTVGLSQCSDCPSWTHAFTGTLAIILPCQFKLLCDHKTARHVMAKIDDRRGVYDMLPCHMLSLRFRYATQMINVSLSPLCHPPCIECLFRRCVACSTPFAQQAPCPHAYNLLHSPLVAHKHSQALRPCFPRKISPRVWI